MRAVIFPAPETIAVQQVPDPACGPNDVVVRVARRAYAARICIFTATSIWDSFR
jgi:threonine dehydrogenase-like Zn-dependent dehydrogenase